MRAGCFAEDRVIELTNRRFVPFYFNRGGPGAGHDPAALEFVNGQTKNQYAYLAAFRPTGEILGETTVYADKEEVIEWLRELLRQHPEYAQPTAEEAAAMAATEAAPEQYLRSARLAEEVGDDAEAAKRYGALAEASAAGIAVPARLGLLRITRHGKQWDAHEQHEAALRAIPDAGPALVDADVERGYRLVAKQDYLAARTLLQPLTKRASSSRRHAEAHFLAGKACWFLGDRDWAKLHWGWIQEHLAEDRLAMRARIASAAEGMPYPNPELDSFKGDVGNIGTQHIVAAVKEAMAVYRAMLPLYEAGDFTAQRAADEDPVATSSPTLLVARLRDGNEHRVANNRVVERLEGIGAGALGPLRAAVEDAAFPGRGYAAWALACVLHRTGARDEATLAVLRAACRDADDYVATLATSGMKRLD